MPEGEPESFSSVPLTFLEGTAHVDSQTSKLAPHRIETSFFLIHYVLICLRTSTDNVKPSQICRISSQNKTVALAHFSSLSLALVNKTNSHPISMPLSSLILLKVFLESPLVPLTTSGFFVLPLLIFHYFKTPACR